MQRKKITMAYGLNVMHYAEFYDVDFDDFAFEGCGLSFFRVRNAHVGGEQGFLLYHNELWDCSFDKLETEKFEVVRNNISNTIFANSLFDGGNKILLQNVLNKVTFVNCNFHKLNMNFNIFNECSFDNCHFFNCVLRDNIMEGCSFYENMWVKTALLNNRVSSSTFEKDFDYGENIGLGEFIKSNGTR